jgi:hypothetical protein
MRSIPDLSPSTPRDESIHATLPSKKWRTLGVKIADYAKAARVFSYQWDFEIKSFKQEQVSLLVPDKTIEEIKKRAEDLEVWIDRRLYGMEEQHIEVSP